MVVRSLLLPYVLLLLRTCTATRLLTLGSYVGLLRVCVRLCLWHVATPQDRRYLIEATVVRIMKVRKVLGHAALLHEVERQLVARFPPSKAAIKKRIESLIEREYLRRDEDDARQYRYLP